MKTLGEFIVEKQHEFSQATGELTALLSAIKLGAKIIHRDINKAGLVDILGASGAENVQGEVQQKLDLFANEKLKAALKARDIVAGIASEEEDEIVVFEGCEHAKYVVLMDPLDGSSNIDVNVSGYDFLDLSPRDARRHAGHRRRFPATRQQTGRCGICRVWLVHHAGLHHRLRRTRFHLRSVVGRVLSVPGTYAFPGKG